MQLISLFNSKTIAMYLFGDKEKGTYEFIDFDTVVTGIRSQLIEPALQKLCSSFIRKLPTEIVALIQFQSERNTSLSALNLCQLVQNHFS